MYMYFLHVFFGDDILPNKSLPYQFDYSTPLSASSEFNIMAAEKEKNQWVNDMGRDSKWICTNERVIRENETDVIRMQIRGIVDGLALSWITVINMLIDVPEFRIFFCDSLALSPFRSFYW